MDNFAPLLGYHQKITRLTHTNVTVSSNVVSKNLAVIRFLKFAKPQRLVTFSSLWLITQQSKQMAPVRDWLISLMN